MLELHGGKLWWGEQDMLAAAKVLGAEPASKGSAPYNPAILRAMEKRGVFLDKNAKAALNYAEHIRDRVKDFRSDTSGAEMPANLWPHQRQLLNFMFGMSGKGFLLADEVGVGKTAPAILFAETFANKRVLVLCRNSAKAQWRREVKRWTSHDAIVVRGNLAEQQARVQRNGWIIGHWESLVNVPYAYTHRPWDVIIADEAHRFQNRKTKRAKTLFELQSDYRLALTAHPYANDPSELWSILRWLYPDIYGSYWRFFGMHVAATPKHFGGFEITGARQPKLLRWELAPFMLRRTRKQVRPWLPQISRSVRTVSLTTNGKRDYERLKKEFFAELRGREKPLPIINMLARTTRMRQYLVDPKLLAAREASVKFPAVLDVLEETQKPTVIFTQFTEAGHNLQAWLSKRHFKVEMLYGDLSESMREKHKANFLKGKYDALIVQLQLGSESLNLGKYGLVCFLDLPWNGRDLEQAEGRVDRPEEGTGTSVPCTSYFIVVEDSYEVRLQKKIEKKHAMFQSVFSHKDIEELFA